MSSQSANALAREDWKGRVKTASNSALPQSPWSTDKDLSVTLYYFPPEAMVGDIDNIVKYILDALKGHAYRDDVQVHRLVVQKFEPGRIFQFQSPSKVLQEAITRDKPILYVRMSLDPFEGLA